MNLGTSKEQPSLLEVLRNTPTDRIAVANALVLKRPPLDRVPPTAELPVFIQLLHSHIRGLRDEHRLLLPNLHDSETIAVFSDYGGDEKDSDYLTYSLLFVSYDIAFVILEDYRALRKERGLHTPYVEVSYKSMDYGPLSRSLVHWLRVSDDLPGLLFTLIVKKDARTIFYDNTPNDLAAITRTLEEEGFGQWKNKTAERLLRILHCIGYFAALLSIPRHKFWWMTDKDEITPNPEKQKHLQRLLGHVLFKYCAKPHKTVAFSQSFDHDGRAANHDHNDLLAIPDLVAGGLANFCTTRLRPAGMERIPKRKSSTIVNWLGHQGIGLKKMQLVISPAPRGTFDTPGGGYRADFLTIEPTDLENVHFVPINL